jgi:dihydroorotate dehydrogenase electron transfer subunit
MMLSACRITGNQLRTNRIIEVKTESPTVKTLAFKDKKFARAMPGQFLMLWIPGTDEIPLSILNAEKKGNVTVAVKNVGEATKAIHELRAGDLIGVRGPFGNNFTLKKGNILIVGGGTGIAPLLFLVNKLPRKAAKLTFVIGARTKNELLLISDIQKACREENVVPTTEDGSYGIKCLATKPLESMLNKEKFEMIYTCGPEKMMRQTFDLAENHGIALEASLERMMRCAIGLCGSCVIGRYRVCRDGPVFTSDQLRQLKDEFGVSKRAFDGKRIPI